MQRLKVKAMLSPTFQAPSFSSSCSSSCLQYSPWSGLQTWRECPLNENRWWGTKGPQPQPLQSLPSSIDKHYNQMVSSASSLAELGALVLSTSDPLAKSRISHLAYSRWRHHRLPLGASDPPPPPARPFKPQLVISPSFMGNLQFHHVYIFSVCGFWDSLLKTKHVLLKLSQTFVFWINCLN